MIKEIKLKGNQLAVAQEEMKIVSELVFNGTKIIMLTRNFLIVTLTALLGYTVKEIIFNNELNNHKRYILLIFIFLMFFLIIMAAVIEGIAATCQNSQINRLWQLDRAINNTIINNISDVPDIFVNKDISFDPQTRAYHMCSQIYHTIKSPSYLFFYLFLLAIPFFAFILWIFYFSWHNFLF